MDAFAAAKRAAQQRGLRAAEAPVDRGPSPLAILWQPKLFLLIIVVALAGWGIYTVTRPKPPRWATFPTTGIDSAKLFLTRISAGDDDSYNQAYALIADSVRDPKDSEERGNYRQIFHNMNLYLSGEFDPGWIAKTQFEADPADPNLIIAHVDKETLHIRTAAQSDPKWPELGSRYEVLGISEFDVRDAAAFRQMAGIEAIIRSSAGQGAVDNIDMIRGTGGAPRHETPMQKKVRLLPIVRNPHSVSWKAVVGLWPVRQDPVVRNRLEQIAGDDRYDNESRARAGDLLKGKIEEEYLVAAGVEE